MSFLFRAASVAASIVFTYAAAGGLTGGAAVSAQVLDSAILATDALPAAPQAQREADDGIAIPSVEAQPAPVAPVVKPPVQAMAEAAARPVDAEQLNCVATAVYYESKGEPVAGQLAVARVIMNRAKSGKFAKTPCGVVLQRSQFSFVRGGVLPAAPQNAMFRQAQMVAKMAMNDVYVGPAANALFFHAKRVSPGWNRQSVGAIGNHIFYK